MRFESYRNKAVVVEVPAANSELAGSSINSEPIISEPEPVIEIEATSDILEEVSTPSYSELNEDVAELSKEGTTLSTINHTSIEESDQPSEYEILRANAMAEKERTSQEKLKKVIAYTKQTLVSYLDETALNRLCGYVTEYYLSDSLPKVEPIKVDSQLKTIDIMHFGWNIGKAFGKPRLQTATFIKKVLPILFVTRKYPLLNVKCRIRNQSVRLNWIERY